MTSPHSRRRTRAHEKPGLAIAGIVVGAGVSYLITRSAGYAAASRTAAMLAVFVMGLWVLAASVALTHGGVAAGLGDVQLPVRSLGDPELLQPAPAG